MSEELQEVPQENDPVPFDPTPTPTELNHWYMQKLADTEMALGVAQIELRKYQARD